jgi:aminoglycoside phosphotransferase (APT) family kinase protein
LDLIDRVHTEYLELISEIARQFDIPGSFLSASVIRSGHINDTYLSSFQAEQKMVRYIHQRINQQVFHQPEQVMENIQRVTDYTRQRIRAAGGNPQRRVLTLIPTRAGQPFLKTAAGEYWRTYLYIEGARSYDVMTGSSQVYSAARAFGEFAVVLDGLPGARLHEVIPDFHHTRKRFNAFRTAVTNDRARRVATVQPEVDFAFQREADASVVVDLLAAGSLPYRITHNDTKLNNVLIDDQSGEGICVIDLDTVMPGSILYDFGDLVRMGTATSEEDEADLEQVGLDMSRFEWLARGYLDAVRQLLVPEEWELLAFAGRLITFEQAIRFLGDYLNGDVYYKTHRSGQNLDRARVQFKMLAEMERQQGEMERVIRGQRGCFSRLPVQ